MQTNKAEHTQRVISEQLKEGRVKPTNKQTAASHHCLTDD